MTRRRAPAVIGLAIVLIYLAGAVVSARLSPFARRPLLDGLAPIAPYRWVSPPPNLADTNKPPTPGRFTMPIDDGHIDGGAFATPDAQVTLIIPRDAFAPAAGQDAVSVTVDPIAPSDAPPVPHDRVVLGNVVRLAATYQPSGDPVTELRHPIEVVLLYPFVRADAGERTLLVSRNGGRWDTVRTTDHVGSAQLIGSVETLGTVTAAGRRLAAAPSGPPGSDGRSSTATVVILVVGGFLVVLVLFLVFGRRREPTRRT
jgi:hypothetical protein